jgi:hypothetical protein
MNLVACSLSHRSFPKGEFPIHNPIPISEVRTYTYRIKNVPSPAQVGVHLTYRIMVLLVSVKAKLSSDQHCKPAQGGLDSPWVAGVVFAEVMVGVGASEEDALMMFDVIVLDDEYLMRSSSQQQFVVK